MGEMDYPVDLVYLWCDGKEAAFAKRKAAYMNQTEDTDAEESFSNKRFLDNEELRYSLRSIEKYAPWIHHIFIVTDRQKPDWLDTDHEKISIVDHSEIMPAEIIPCFNSVVIERYIGFIPGLAEHFLYANDDMFIGRPVEKEFFFHDGKPVVRLKYLDNSEKVFTESELREFTAHNFFGKSIVNAWRLFFRKNGLGRGPLWEPHHNIDSFLKSAYLHTFSKYKTEFEKTAFRFRSTEDIQRVVFSLELLLGRPEEKQRVRRNSTASLLKHLLLSQKPLACDSFYCDVECKGMFKLCLAQPTLFCLNGAGNKKWGDRLEKMYLQRRFPRKSSFEK